MLSFVLTAFALVYRCIKLRVYTFVEVNEQATSDSATANDLKLTFA